MILAGVWTSQFVTEWIEIFFERVKKSIEWKKCLLSELKYLLNDKNIVWTKWNIDWMTWNVYWTKKISFERVWIFIERTTLVIDCWLSMGNLFIWVKWQWLWKETKSRNQGILVRDEDKWVEQFYTPLVENQTAAMHLPTAAKNDISRIDTSATILAVNMPNDNRLYTTGGNAWRNYVTTISNLEQQSGMNAVMLDLFQSIAINVRSYLKLKVYQWWGEHSYHCK